jgi:hypothetical protein
VAQAQRRVGVVLERASRVLGEEPFHHEFIEGLERVLPPDDDRVPLPAGAMTSGPPAVHQAPPAVFVARDRANCAGYQRTRTARAATSLRT